MVKRTLLASLSLACVLILAPTFVAADPIISAPFVTVGVGDTFTIPISISDAVALEFFQFDLSFSPLIVEASILGATPGALLPAAWFFTGPGIVDNTGGQILGVSAYGSAFSGSGVIANIDFTALVPGVSPLIFSKIFLNLLDTGFSIVGGEITVTGVAPVPEPTTLILLGSGLGLLALRRLSISRRHE